MTGNVKIKISVIPVLVRTAVAWLVWSARQLCSHCPGQTAGRT